ETLKAAMSRARDLLGTCASLEDVKTSLAALEEASLWVLDPGTSSRQPQEEVEVLTTKLARFQALAKNAPEVEGLRRKDKKAEAEQLRMDLASQLIAPNDDERRRLAQTFRELCTELDGRCARARTRRRTSSCGLEPPEETSAASDEASLSGWLSSLIGSGVRAASAG
ncbi:unnamed protein product, partial [Effrenium voratum]